MINKSLYFNKVLFMSWLKKGMFAIFFCIILSFFVNIKLILFVVFCTIVNTWVVLSQAKNGLPTDIEFSTVGAVIGSSIFGLSVGIFLAIFTKLFTNFIKGKFIIDHVFQIASYCMAALIASYFHTGNMVALGLWITLITNVFMFLVSKYLIAVPLVDNLAYTVTNAIGNMIFFTTIASPIYFIFK
jgi:hypothetical protein